MTTLEASGERAARDILKPDLRLVAWELTKSCNLFCAHCRGSSANIEYAGELSTQECFRIIDQIADVARPILILTGGEPLMRPDFFEIAGYAARWGLRCVIGTNGTLLTAGIAARLKQIPIARIGVSLDFPTPDLQDRFRGQPGAFKAALDGIKNARSAGIEVQINSTVTKLNVSYLDELLSLALENEAVAFHPFMLVPTGRGKVLEIQELPPQEYETTLNWIYDRQLELGSRIFFKPTDAPHYLRIVRQRQNGQPAPASRPGSGGHPGGITRGCLAGTGFCFISHQGKVKGCGYFDVEAGDLKINTFREVWADSALFNRLRDLRNLKGKCGACEFRRICGGCRARAYESTGDYLEAEPYCVYQPRMGRHETRA